MSKPPRTANSGTFFLTSITRNRRRVFQVDANARMFMETLNQYRLEGFYKLWGFVVMPDHVHLLLTTEDLAGAMQRIKGGFSHKLNSSFPVWQNQLYGTTLCRTKLSLSYGSDISSRIR